MLDKNTVTRIVEYVGITGNVINGYHQKVASLEKELAGAKTMAKEASAKAASKDITLDAKAVSDTVSKMARAGLLKQAEQQKAMAQITENPSVLLTYLNKIAEREISTVRPMAKTASSREVKPEDRESDRVFEETFKRISTKI